MIRSLHKRYKSVSTREKLRGRERSSCHELLHTKRRHKDIKYSSYRFPNRQHRLLYPLLPSILHKCRRQLQCLCPRRFRGNRSPTSSTTNSSRPKGPYQVHNYLPSAKAPSTLQLSHRQFKLQVLLVIRRLRRTMSKYQTKGRHPTYRRLP